MTTPLPSPPPLLAAVELGKRYGKNVALDRLTLDVPRGSVFGLLGPNGAGKSTFLQLVLGLLRPDSGHLERNGLAPAQIGYVPDRLYFPPRAQVQEYVSLAAELGGLSGNARDQAVALRLQQVGLREAATKRVGALSKGMLQRLALAAALIGDPSLLLLDEPTSGLDPAWQKWLRLLVQSLHSEGRTIVLSTHRLDELTQLCTHLCLLKRGRAVRAGSAAELLPLRPQVTVFTTPLPDSLSTALGALAPQIQLFDDRIVLEGPSVALKGQVLRRLLDAEVEILDLRQARATLEELYLEAQQG